MGFFSSRVEECERMLAGPPARMEERLDALTRDLGKSFRAPAGLSVLLDNEGADALDHVAVLEGGVHEVQLHAQALCERQGRPAAQLLQRHGEHGGRAAPKGLERLLR